MSISQHDRRQALRAAVRIHDQLRGAACLHGLPGLPHESWQALCDLTTRFSQVRSRGWQIASQSLLVDLEYAIRSCRRALDAFADELPRSNPTRFVVGAGDIAGDLAALREEFDNVAVDSKEQTISVVTGPIELEDVYLGRFRVVLSWTQIGRTRPYEVIAEDPNPAEENEDVTHPHVRDNILCEGEGALPIKTALAQGHLLDFFSLVNQILGTYNAHSAHVTLAQWQGRTCHDCGGWVSREEFSTCERCDRPLCGDCTCSCGSCDRYVCSGCGGECSRCGCYFCQSCLTMRPGSEEANCETCMEVPEDQEEDSQDENAINAPQQAQPASPSHFTTDATCSGPAPESLFLGEAPARA